MMIPFNVPITDLQERFQSLQNEKTKYICPDYAASSNYTHHGREDWEDRLKRVMKFRKETLLYFYDWTGSLDLPSDVMSTAAYIFDKYLSTFLPQYIRGEIKRCDKHGLIGLSCFFIAIKSLLSWDEIDHIVNRFGKRSREVFLADVETKVLKALKWQIVYTSPMSIIQDLITLLPQYHNYGYAGALDSFKHSVLKESSQLIKLTVVNYGFNIRYPPQSIALAVLMLSFELCSSAHQPLCKLIRPMAYLSYAFEKFGLGCLSFGDEEVVKCRNDILYSLKQGKSSYKKRSDTNSHTVVAEMHTSRGTTKKSNSFVAKTA